MLLSLLREFKGYTLETLRREGTGLLRLLAVERAVAEVVNARG